MLPPLFLFNIAVNIISKQGYYNRLFANWYRIAQVN